MRKLDPLVLRLIERQAEAGMTSRQMAARLEITEQNWCHIRKGRRGRHGLPLRVMKRAFAVYPELAVLFLTEALRPSATAQPIAEAAS